MLSLRLFLTLAVIALATPDPSLAATRIGKPRIDSERAKLSYKEVRKVVSADLNSIIASFWTSGFVTKPYASTELGLCRADAVAIRYLPTGEGPNAPLKPVGIASVISSYSYPGLVGQRSLAEWQKVCEGLSGEKIRWITSDDDRTALWSLSRLRWVRDAIDKNEAVTFDCTDVKTREPGFDCRSAFLSAANQVESTGRCPSRAYDCYQYATKSYPFTLAITYPAGRTLITIKLAEIEIMIT